jgi:hypothetical protein
MVDLFNKNQRHAKLYDFLLVKIMKLRIDDYSFGKMVVGGKEFGSDLILHPDGRIQNNWRRSQGHNLLMEDIATVLDGVPDKLVIGTGANGMMKVSEGAMKLCKNRGIEIEVYRTTDAVTRFNKAVEAGITVAACFHLTC